MKAIFLRFGDDFWVILGARLGKKSIKNQLKFEWNFLHRNWRLEPRFGRLERLSGGWEPCDGTQPDGLGVPKRNFVSENENEKENENENENGNENEA